MGPGAGLSSVVLGEQQAGTGRDRHRISGILLGHLEQDARPACTGLACTGLACTGLACPRALRPRPAPDVARTGKGRTGSEMAASRVARRRRNANANQVGDHRTLRQNPYRAAYGRLIASTTPPPAA